MRALLLTVLAVIVLISAGVGYLAFSPKPNDISPKVVLVIEPDTVQDAKSDIPGKPVDEAIAPQPAETAAEDTASATEEDSGEKDTQTAETDAAPEALTVAQFLAQESEGDSSADEESPEKAGETAAETTAPADDASEDTPAEQVASAEKAQPEPSEETPAKPARRDIAVAALGPTKDEEAPKVAGPQKPKPRVILLVRGLGVDPSTTQSAIEDLPPQVSLAFVPYGKGLKQWATKARERKHEILVQIPLEPQDYPTNNPGPHTLLTSLTMKENLERLDWLLSRFDHFTGVTNYLGGKLGSSPNAFAPLLMELKSRGLIYLDDGKTAMPTTQQLSRQLAVPYAAANVIIDADPAPAKIETALANVLATAKEKGIAIAIGHAFPATISVLKKWLQSLKEEGVAVVPVSTVSKLSQGRS